MSEPTTVKDLLTAMADSKLDTTRWACLALILREMMLAQGFDPYQPITPPEDES